MVATGGSGTEKRSRETKHKIGFKKAPKIIIVVLLYFAELETRNRRALARIYTGGRAGPTRGSLTVRGAAAGRRPRLDDS